MELPESGYERKYSRRIVRDLAWAVASPPLMAFTTDPVFWPDAGWYFTQYREHEQLFTALEADPAPLAQFLETGKRARLGTYFERLVAFWLGNSGRYELILANRQISERGRTLGEIDFILRDRETELQYHWETAVKFFLGCGDTTRRENWFGPNKADKLDRKIRALVTRQLRLSEEPAVRSLLDSQGIEIDGRMAFVKGRLFFRKNGATGQTTAATVPSESAAPRAGTLPAGADVPPEGAAPAHLRGWYMTADEFRAYAADHGKNGLRWAVLEKPYWLSSVFLKDPLEWGSSEDAAAAAEKTSFSGPVCVAGADREGERERGFLIPRGWEKREWIRSPLSRALHDRVPGTENPYPPVSRE